MGQSSASDHQKMLAMLYDQHAAVVLGFLEKLTDNKDKAEESLQAVFLALPSKLEEFDAQKGRFVVWILKLARTIAGQGQKTIDFKTNARNAPMKEPIRNEGANVDSSNINPSREPGAGTETSVVELLYVKGFTFAQVAAKLGVDERSVHVMVRTELKKYRR